MLSKMRTLTGVIVSVALCLSACGGGSGGSDVRRSDTITLGVAYETTNYNPSNTSSALAMGTNWHVVEGLYEFDMSDYSTYPALAKGEPKKLSKTKLQITLRDGAKFSDGTPVTPKDVVSSFERAMVDGNIYQSMLSFIDTVTPKGKNSVIITMKEPFSLAEKRLAIVKIVPSKATDDELTKMPIGSGPFKYESISDAEVSAVPNEYYNGPKPAGAQRLVWSVIKDDTARTTAASSGTIDVMESVPAANIPLLNAAEMTVEEVEGFNMPFLLFNTEKKPFNSAKVRQAFFYAIDTEKLIANNMDGKAKAATSFVPESNPAYHRASTVFTYDPEKAKQLLKEGGAENLEITLITTDNPWISGLAPQIKNNLEAVGVKVNLQAEAAASLYSNHLDVDKPVFDVVLAPGDPSVFGNDPALLINWWYGDNVWTQKRTFWQKSDKAAFEKLQAILNKGVTLEGKAQQEKWNEAYDFISEQVPIYPLFHRTMLTGYNPKKLDGFKAIGTTGLTAVGTVIKK